MKIKYKYLQKTGEAYYIPVIFFTVQKSIDKSRTTMTKLVMKLLPNNSQSIYTTIASTLKARWKNVTYGCLKSNETKVTRFCFMKPCPSVSVNVQTITSIFRRLRALQTFITRSNE
jgi:hypothetical protein